MGKGIRESAESAEPRTVKHIGSEPDKPKSQRVREAAVHEGTESRLRGNQGGKDYWESRLQGRTRKHPGSGSIHSLVSEGRVNLIMGFLDDDSGVWPSAR
jgi:hypothetical protein